ncbi:MAG: ThiF family adenylyltransferase [Planctomycetes bacterium]|nr:ThiF family adenylyltransferase [Planctomycetota bacterium]
MDNLTHDNQAVLKEMTPSWSLGEFDLRSCLPELPDLNWDLVREWEAFLVGAGAIGRELAWYLSFLGVRRIYLCDPKKYKQQSVVSQCDPQEVDRPKAEVVADWLGRWGVDAIPLVADVWEVEPGYITPQTVVIASVDNRRADIGAARLAGMMRALFMKLNVDQPFLSVSLRCYDLRPEIIELCPECQMTDQQYLDQRHPRSCDGDVTGQATGSPRPQCGLAAAIGALAFAQLVGSPDRWAKPWIGRQWLGTLLGGGVMWSQLVPKPGCRWQHGRHWQGVQRLATGPADATLVRLLDVVGDQQKWGGTQLQFSARVATSGVCDRCGHVQKILRWMRTASDPVGQCPCGGTLTAVPFHTYQTLPAGRVKPWWEQTLASWGVPPFAIIAVEDDSAQQHSFVVGGSVSAQPAGARGGEQE